MSIDVAAPQIADWTNLAALVTNLIILAINVLLFRFTQWDDIVKSTGQMIQLGMQYPFVEKESFCEKFRSTDSSDAAAQYQLYCCFVFNIIERAWRHYRILPVLGEKWLVERYHVDELFWSHRVWWRSDRANHKGYPRGFRRFVRKRLAITEAKQRQS